MRSRATSLPARWLRAATAVFALFGLVLVAIGASLTAEDGWEPWVGPLLAYTGVWFEAAAIFTRLFAYFLSRQPTTRILRGA